MVAADESLREAVGPREAPEAEFPKLAPGPGLPASDVAAHQSARIHRAMTQIVADRGYEAVKVRELVRLAGISSRAFYEHFDSKEDCFLHSYDLIARRTTGRMVAAQDGERDWRERPRLVFEAFAGELQGDPAAARLALVHAYEAGPSAREHVRRAERGFEGMLAASFARAPGGIAVPEMVAEGMMGGLFRVARTRLLSGREDELTDLVDELTEWALCYPGRSASTLSSLDPIAVAGGTAADPLDGSGAPAKSETWPATSDRALLLAAVARLAIASGYGDLTRSNICRAAGVSRKKFDSHFDGAEDCYLAALEQRAGDAMVHATRAQTAGRSWPGGVYRAIYALCSRVVEDPILTSACLADEFAADSRGSRARLRLIAAVADQLASGTPPESRTSPLVTEASSGAVWALFHRHVVRAPAHARPQVAATISFMALAPSIGADAAVAAIRAEQQA